MSINNRKDIKWYLQSRNGFEEIEEVQEDALWRYMGLNAGLYRSYKHNSR